MNTEDRDLLKLFSPFGNVRSAEVVKDKLSGRSKRNGIIEMPTDSEARQAIISLSQTVFDGNITITISDFSLLRLPLYSYFEPRISIH